jgi:hypothetical protein
VLAIVLVVAGSLRLAAWDAAGAGPTSVTLKPYAPDPISGNLDAVRSQHPGVRVLFVGNSQTFFNDMPTMVEQLAEGDRGAPRIFAVQYAPGGWQLELAARDKRLRELIASEAWDVVVLQEQSWIASAPRYRTAHTFPAATALKRMADARGARTLLFMTWGYRYGSRSDRPGDDYSAMQARVAAGYRELGARLDAEVAPAGLAWERAYGEGLDLWTPEGRHPSRAGSYLAACVLYGRISGRDPRGTRPPRWLPRDRARRLRRIAASF